MQDRYARFKNKGSDMLFMPRGRGQPKKEKRKRKKGVTGRVVDPRSSAKRELTALQTRLKQQISPAERRTLLNRQGILRKKIRAFS